MGAMSSDVLWHVEQAISLAVYVLFLALSGYDVRRLQSRKKRTFRQKIRRARWVYPRAMLLVSAVGLVRGLDPGALWFWPLWFVQLCSDINCLVLCGTYMFHLRTMVAVFSVSLHGHLAQSLNNDAWMVICLWTLVLGALLSMVWRTVARHMYDNRFLTDGVVMLDFAVTMVVVVCVLQYCQSTFTKVAASMRELSNRSVSPSAPSRSVSAPTPSPRAAITSTSAPHHTSVKVVLTASYAKPSSADWPATRDLPTLPGAVVEAVTGPAVAPAPPTRARGSEQAPTAVVVIPTSQGVTDRRASQKTIPAHSQTALKLEPLPALHQPAAAAAVVVKPPQPHPPHTQMRQHRTNHSSQSRPSAAVISVSAPSSVSPKFRAHMRYFRSPRSSQRSRSSPVGKHAPMASGSNASHKGNKKGCQRRAKRTDEYLDTFRFVTNVITALIAVVAPFHIYLAVTDIDQPEYVPTDTYDWHTLLNQLRFLYMYDVPFGSIVLFYAHTL